MKASEMRVSRILSRIRQEFLTYRQRRGSRGAGYPSRLKALALAALSQGHAASAVALAAGVTPEAVRLWKKAHDAEVPKQQDQPVSSSFVGQQPIELKLVDPKPAESVARMRFRSGVRLEIPASALTPELVSALHGAPR